MQNLIPFCEKTSKDLNVSQDLVEKIIRFEYAFILSAMKETQPTHYHNAVRISGFGKFSINDNKIWRFCDTQEDFTRFKKLFNPRLKSGERCFKEGKNMQ